MKKALYLVFAMSALLFVSCVKEEKKGDGDQFYLTAEGLMRDAGFITKMELYCFEIPYGPANVNIPSFYYWNYTYKQLEPIFTDYPSVNIYIVFRDAGIGFLNDTIPFASDINQLLRQYLNQRCSYVYNEYKNLRNPMQWPSFYTSYVNDEVELTCDKVLFGQKPGANLSNHFKLIPTCYCLPIGRENPTMLYGFEDIKKLLAGVCMADFFQKDTWMQNSYLIQFLEEPEEKYENLTFKITFPASIEHACEYVTSVYEGKTETLRITDETFTDECSIKFDWK